MYRLRRQCELCSKNVNYLSAKCLRKRQLSQERPKPNSELAAAYKPREVEQSQIDENYFRPQLQLTNEKPFSLILPPPNITGTLHLGHALTATVQDVLVKWHRMHGKQTVWVPGLDHAGIATQVVVEKKLFKEKGLTRHQLGREAFEQEIWKWTQEKSSTIVQQLRRLNINLDWPKEVFTMDQQRSKAVTEAFIRLFDAGLIYRADHLVNWSCALQSAISDIEVDHLEVDGATDLAVPGYDKMVRFGVLTNFAYKIEGSLDEIVVATTRPETILGDVAVAVNPKDVRYTSFIGKRLRHPFRDDVIPVIADDFVDPDFGTGAVKITPAHDPKDFEAGKRHSLKSLTVIDAQGLMASTHLNGMKRFDARETIISQLHEKQLLRGTSDHKMMVPICSRSKDIVEFLIRPQWFLKCSEMAQKAVADVRQGALKIEPEVFEKVWFQWLENIRDWCVSRQLWWGHRIPAYYCSSNSGYAVWVAASNSESAKIKAAKLLNCEQLECVQDDDVLDTWFSSALQPFTVFGWPENTQDLATLYPLSLMETGHDILFFWVARMVMLGTKLTGELPFKHILLHGIICDAHGKKMSKSLGNVVAPEEVIDGSTLEQLKATLQQSFDNGTLTIEELHKANESQKKMFPSGIPECGADALRFTLLSHNVKSHVINFDVAECRTNQLFGNKIWQATKFTLLWIGNVAQAQKLVDEDCLGVYSPMDNWILSRLSCMVQTVEEALEKHEFYVATAALKEFLYYEYCDVYLEAIKTDLKERTGEPTSKAHCHTLLTCLDQSLRALAPFMPALAQHLHKHLPSLWNIGADKSFPKALNLRNEPLEREVAEMMELVISIRRLKKIFNVTYKYKPEVFLVACDTDMANKFTQVIKDLSHLYTLHVSPHKPQLIKGVVEDSVGSNKVYLVVPEELRKSLELDVAKMAKQKEKLEKELEKLKGKEIYAKKISQIADKITRIDYIRGLTNNNN